MRKIFLSIIIFLIQSSGYTNENLLRVNCFHLKINQTSKDEYTLMTPDSSFGKKKSLSWGEVPLLYKGHMVDGQNNGLADLESMVFSRTVTIGTIGSLRELEVETYILKIIAVGDYSLTVISNNSNLTSASEGVANSAVTDSLVSTYRCN